MPTKSKNANRAQRQNDRANSQIPAADQAEARVRKMELTVRDKTISEINKSVGEFRAKGERIRDGFIELVNDGRQIGILINGFLDTLPGKQMTIDFWQQWQERFIDRKGTSISLDELKYFVRLAKNLPEPIRTLAEARQAQQLAFAAAGFNLISDRPQGIAHTHIPYNDFMSIFTGYRPILQKLAQDPNYGPIENWPTERKERAWLELKPLYEDVILKLKPDRDDN